MQSGWSFCVVIVWRQGGIKANAWGNNTHFRLYFPLCQHKKHVFAVGTKTTLSVVDKLLPILPFKSRRGNMQIKQSALSIWFCGQLRYYFTLTSLIFVLKKYKLIRKFQNYVTLELTDPCASCKKPKFISKLVIFKIRHECMNFGKMYENVCVQARNKHFFCTWKQRTSDTVLISHIFEDLFGWIHKTRMRY